jgi:PHD/YefM family antitoxin component YafN of YafNO toxin-antitoxin module
MSDNWQATRARTHFSEIIDAAIDGKPQFIRRRDGLEVVLVSRDYFDRTKMNLKSYLLTAGYAPDEPDAFDEAMATVRSRLPPIVPRSLRRKA